MKLNTKLTLCLVLGLGTIVALVQSVQYLDQTRRITQQIQSDIAVLESQADQNARNVYDSIQNSLAGSLERGEMEKFNNLLREQKNVKGLLEFSLYDRNGVVTHSSDTAHLGQKLPGSLKDQLLSKPDEQIVKTDQTIEIFKPTPIEGDCIRCHTDWPRHGVGGVTYFQFSTKELADARTNAHTMLSSIRGAMFRNSIIALIVLVVIIYVMASFLVGRPLKSFFAMLNPIETDSRNLTYQIPVTRSDEIGRLAETLNTFTGNLDEVIGSAQEIGKRVGTEASRQAATVEETSSEMQEISSQTKQNTGNAQKANQLMGEISQQTHEANKAMQNLSVTMKEISEASSKTSSIVKTIDGIASQTNLLALNAAVEAARAGEAGKGFSVVADAVRKLAMGCAEAARNIGHLIDDTVAKVQKGEQVVTTTSKRFEQLAQQNVTATKLIDEIAHSSEQQSQAIDTVNSALSDLDHSTQQNAMEAEQLMQAMEQFKTSASDRSDPEKESAPSHPTRMPARAREFACGESV
ncbi:MAG: HAMP domain-containing protein [Phycisphaerae bacterium]|nr:HAMP domain-containing protein [Phycisphaerae bacterium]